MADSLGEVELMVLSETRQPNRVVEEEVEKTSSPADVSPHCYFELVECTERWIGVGRRSGGCSDIRRKALYHFRLALSALALISASRHTTPILIDYFDEHLNPPHARPQA